MTKEEVEKILKDYLMNNPQDFKDMWIKIFREVIHPDEEGVSEFIDNNI